MTAIPIDNRPMTTETEMSPGRTARYAGACYLILIPLGFFGIAYVPEILVIQGNMAKTFENIATSDMLFRLSLASAFLMNIVAIFLVLFLYKLLSPVSRSIAVLMVVFLLAGVCISMLNEVNHFAVLMLSSADIVTGFTYAQTLYLGQLFLEMREYGSYIAGLF